MRKSNMELLRIVAMLLVLVLHATFETLHYPNSTLVRAEPLSWLGIIFSAQASMCCVDVFVLITGWFGTHFKMQNLGRLVFQVVFTCLFITAVMTLIHGELPGSALQIVQSVYGYWFINSYLLLYLFSPVLNAFVAQTNEVTLRRFLIVFYLFTIPASFILDDLDRGFSTLSFMGLYLLGRYLCLYAAPRLKGVPRHRFLGVYIINTVFFAVVYWLYFWLKPVNYPNPTMLMTAYSNPFIMLNAVCLLLYFARFDFSNRWINLLASGSLAVYLLHQHQFVRNSYFELIRYFDAQFSTGTFVVLTAVGIAGIYLAATGMDLIRQWFWKSIYSLFSAKKREKA